MKTVTAPSIYSIRQYLKWARQQNSATLVGEIKKACADLISVNSISRRGNLKIKLSEHATLVARTLKRELSARARVQKKVSDLAASANGIAYHSTQGWWITPMLTESGTVGLVNTSRGVAIDTGVKISKSEILSTVLPAGKLMSGNLAANSGVCKFPQGWRQISADSRHGTARPATEIMPFAKVVATGLATCYGGEAGDIGATYEQACGWLREFQSPFCCNFEPGTFAKIA